MTYILIIFFSAYHRGEAPHYMGEYHSKEQCQIVGNILKKKGDAHGYQDVDYECVEK